MGRLPQINVTPVVAISVVDGLEVVEVGHHQGRVTESIGLLEQLPADPEEGLTAVQPGQGVVIALVLDAAALGHRRLVVVGAQGHDGFRQLVQLPDAGAGKFRHGLPLFLCVHQLF